MLPQTKTSCLFGFHYKGIITKKSNKSHKNVDNKCVIVVNVCLRLLFKFDINYKKIIVKP